MFSIFILAFKAFALWKCFPIFREYIRATTASSLYEARLGFEEFGAKTHTFSPAYTDYEINDIASYSSHLTFNSLSQYERFHKRVCKENPDISLKDLGEIIPSGSISKSGVNHRLRKISEFAENLRKNIS